jgi:hypothetical protein
MIARYLTSENYDVGPELQPWVDALRAIDRKNESDKTELISLVASPTPVSRLARLFLADLLDRKKLQIVTRYSLPETSSVDPELVPWVEALLAIDRSDKTKLSGLLTSDTSIPPLARAYLAELLRCHKLLNPKNNPPTPLYKFSDYVSKLARAREAVRYLRRNGEPLNSAIEQAAVLYNLTPNAVRRVHEGTDSNFRTMVKSRPHLNRR